MTSLMDTSAVSALTFPFLFESQHASVCGKLDIYNDTNCKYYTKVKTARDHMDYNWERASAQYSRVVDEHLQGAFGHRCVVRICKKCVKNLDS